METTAHHLLPVFRLRATEWEYSLSKARMEKKFLTFVKVPAWASTLTQKGAGADADGPFILLLLLLLLLRLSPRLS